MDVNERVLSNLKLFKLDTDIDPVTMKHLVKVDEVIESMRQAMTNAVHEIKSCKFSINRISQESNIARQTFYNNPILIRYIENYIATYLELSPFETIEYLRELIRRRDVQIAELVQRDATVFKYKVENKELTDEIVSLRSIIESQADQIRQLRINITKGLK